MLDLFCHGRLGDGERLCGGAEAFVFSGKIEDFQLIEVQGNNLRLSNI